MMGWIPFFGPRLLRLLGVTFCKVEETEFFISVVEAALKDRLAKGERRNDLLDLMADALKQDESGRISIS